MAVIGFANIGNTIKPIDVGRNDGNQIVGFFDGATEIGMNDRGVMKKFLPLPADPNRWCKVEVLDGDRYEMMWGSEKRFVNKGTEYVEENAQPINLGSSFYTNFLIRFQFPKDTFNKYASVYQEISLRGMNGSGETSFVKIKFDRESNKTQAKVKLETSGGSGSINTQFNNSVVFDVERPYVLYICEKVTSSNTVETHVKIYDEVSNTLKVTGKVTTSGLSLNGTFSGKSKMVPFKNSDHFKVRSTLVMFDNANVASMPFSDDVIQQRYIEWYKDVTLPPPNLNDVFTFHSLDVVRDELFPYADPIQFEVPIEITKDNKRDSLNPFIFRYDYVYGGGDHLKQDNDPKISLANKLFGKNYSLEALDYYYNGRFAWDGRYEEFAMKLLMALTFSNDVSNAYKKASIGKMVVENKILVNFPTNVPGVSVMIGYVDLEIDTTSPEIEVYSRYMGNGIERLMVNDELLFETNYFNVPMLNNAVILFYRKGDGKYLYGYLPNRRNAGGGGDKNYTTNGYFPRKEDNQPTPRTLQYTDIHPNNDTTKASIKALHLPTYTLANQRVEELVKMDIGNADTIGSLISPYEVYTNPIENGRTTTAYLNRPLNVYPTYYHFKPVLKPRDKTITSVDGIVARIYLTK